jgi:hypothetical protein
MYLPFIIVSSTGTEAKRKDEEGREKERVV